MCSPPWSPSKPQQLSTDDQAALLAIAGGAKLYEHLLTGRMSVTAASGTRIPHTKLRRLEDAGLVARDTGPPYTLASRSRSPTPEEPRCPPPAGPPTTQTPKVPARPGISPSTPAQRR
nr:hypothetical protein [Streptomyces sp. DSM 40713]